MYIWYFLFFLGLLIKFEFCFEVCKRLIDGRDEIRILIEEMLFFNKFENVSMVSLLIFF